MIDWQLKSYEQLTKDELYELLRLRMEVFVVEQDCVYQDLDNKDQRAFHLLGKKAGELVAYARCYAKTKDTASFGRVIISEKVRGCGYAHSLIERVIQIIKENYKPKYIVISAQEHLRSLYESHGFVVEGQPYLEDNKLLHIKMALHDISYK